MNYGIQQLLTGFQRIHCRRLLYTGNNIKFMQPYDLIKADMTEVHVIEECKFIDELKSLIESIANDSLKMNGTFSVGLSGGSLVNLLENVLPKIQTSWQNWHFFFCDERIVSFDNPDSTYGLYKNNLLRAIPINETQFYKVNPQLSASEAATDYANQLISYFGNGLPRFDLLLLGLGPDGHTCSLFPNHHLLSEKKLWVAPITDSPKPPSSRITLTFTVINNAKNCIFAISGKGKAEIIKKILVDNEDLPASMVKPTSGKLYWIVDKAAAMHLPSEYCTA